MYVASIEPDWIATPASEPELKYVTWTSTPGSASSNMPSSSATKPGACVRFGKIPSRSTSALPAAFCSELAHAAPSMATAASPTTSFLIRTLLPETRKGRDTDVSRPPVLWSAERGRGYPARPADVNAAPVSPEAELLRHLDLDDLPVLHHQQHRAELDPAQDLDHTKHDLALLIREVVLALDAPAVLRFHGATTLSHDSRRRPSLRTHRHGNDDEVVPTRRRLRAPARPGPAKSRRAASSRRGRA